MNPTTSTRKDATIERGLASALGELRRYAARADRDDFYGAAAAEMLDTRPLVVLAVLTKDRTQAWVMHPPADQRSVVVSTIFDHGSRNRAIATGADEKSYLLAEVARLADWLHKEDHGMSLAEEEWGGA
jgi:hypothetical protein